VFVDSAPEFFPPQPKIIDFSEIDVILISNYLCMLALPFITEGTGFSGVVYATEPTLQIGRLVECRYQKENKGSSVFEVTSNRLDEWRYSLQGRMIFSFIITSILCMIPTQLPIRFSNPVLEKFLKHAFHPHP
jgi:hypothetical protein